MAGSFRKFDAGAGFRQPKGLDEGDCQVRALSKAGGYTFPEAWDVLYTLQGTYRSMGFNIKLYLEKGELGVVRKLSFPAKKGQPRMKASEFARRYPKGSFILHQANHVVAVEDGIVYDRFDSTARCVYEAWEIKRRNGREPQSGQTDQSDVQNDDGCLSLEA
jgi:hypothetical protein